MLKWGGLKRGRVGVDVADIVGVKQGMNTKVFQEFGEDRCSDRYVSFILTPNGFQTQARTLDLILESRTARDLVARCMLLLLSLNRGEQLKEQKDALIRRFLASPADDIGDKPRVDIQVTEKRSLNVQWDKARRGGETIEEGTLKGYLTKDSGGQSVVSRVYGKFWKRRYFILDGHSLRYFMDETLDVMKGSIHVSDILDVISIENTPAASEESSIRKTGKKFHTSKERPYYFQVITTRRKWHMAASMDSERRRWIEAIKRYSQQAPCKRMFEVEGTNIGSSDFNWESDNSGPDLIEKRLRLHRGESLRTPIDLGCSSAITAKEALPIAIREACILQQDKSLSKMLPPNRVDRDVLTSEPQWRLSVADFSYSRKSILSANGTKFEFEDIAPAVFLNIRRRFQLSVSV